jgi:hypothetical protein
MIGLTVLSSVPLNLNRGHDLGIPNSCTGYSRLRLVDIKCGHVLFLRQCCLLDLLPPVCTLAFINDLDVRRCAFAYMRTKQPAICHTCRRHKIGMHFREASGGQHRSSPTSSEYDGNPPLTGTRGLVILQHKLSLR